MTDREAIKVLEDGRLRHPFKYMEAVGAAIIALVDRKASIAAMKECEERRRAGLECTKTNADHICAMSDEDIAHAIYACPVDENNRVCIYGLSDQAPTNYCERCILNWLKQPYLGAGSNDNPELLTKESHELL